MSNAAQTQVSGTVTVRPVVLGVAVDLSTANEVTRVLRALARAWGGCFSVVMSETLGVDDLEARMQWFDLDSLWLWNEEHELSGTLRDKHLLWRGSGDWGPFGAGRYTHGLMPWKGLQGVPSDVDADHDPLLDWFESGSSGPAVHLANMSEVPSTSLTRSLNHSPPVIVLLDRDSSVHQVQAWNVRAVATRLAVVDDDNGRRTVDWDEVVQWCRAPRRDDTGEIREVWVWDLRNGSRPTSGLASLDGAMKQAEVNWVRHLQERPPAMYPRVLKTDFNTSFNVTVPYGAMRPAVSIPTVPLGGDGGALGDYRTVAAEVFVNSVTGHDPRLVARLPDDPRFSDLLDFVTDDVLRVRRPTEWGFVVGVSAASSSLNVQLHRKSEVFRRLLGSEGVLVEQSDVGLFQTRAAEMLGGASSGALTQPGLAAGLRLLASHPAGVPLARLKAEITNNRGAWPGELSGTSPSDYAEGVLRGLVGSGMVRAVLKAKCTYCRATMQLEPEDMASTMLCDFCGQEVRLAPMIGWGSPKWVFRLAGHLSDAQVQAMIPALATLGQLSHLTGLQGGIDCSELGLTVTCDGKSMEADIAAYLRSPIPVTVIGEVKSRNRIDANDVANLEWLQDRLSVNGFDSIILFATTKDSFGPEETEALRKHCDERAVPLDVRRSATPRLPIVLTGRDLFLPWMHDDNVGRWARESPALAIHGTALESCQRNLGLDRWAFEKDKVRLTWKKAAMSEWSRQ